MLISFCILFATLSQQCLLCFLGFVLMLLNFLCSFADAEGKQALAVHWEPPPESAYKWKHKHPLKPKSLRIYECHVGICSQEPKVSSFSDFISKVTALHSIFQLVLTSKLLQVLLFKNLIEPLWIRNMIVFEPLV